MNFALPGLLNPETPESDRVPEIKSFLPYAEGTLWEGASIGPITFFGSQPAYAATSARLRFFDDDMAVALELNSDDGDISITDAGLWTFVVNRETLSPDLGLGLWKWIFSVTSNSVEEDIYRGVMAVKPSPESA